MQSRKLRAFLRMYWVFFLIKQRLYQMTYLKFNTDLQRTTWPPGSWLPPNSRKYFYSILHSCKCNPEYEGARKHRLYEFNHERSCGWFYLKQIELFVGLPGHQVTGYHPIVGNIFIQQYIYADVSLNTRVLESIGCTNLTMKGFTNEYLFLIEQL